MAIYITNLLIVRGDEREGRDRKEILFLSIPNLNLFLCLRVNNNKNKIFLNL